eukprot:gene9715-10702_t
MSHCRSSNWSFVKETPLEWFSKMPHSQWKEFFDKKGYLIVFNLLDAEMVEYYRGIYGKMLDGRIDTIKHRHDLGSHEKRRKEAQENVCQIMWPSEYLENLTKGPLHERAALISKYLLGEDIQFDFDMLISKAAHTDTAVPWHQDEAYWSKKVNMPDKRAVSCWVAIDDAIVENGCMWFVPGSHVKQLRPHHPASVTSHSLVCQCSEDEGVPVLLPAGACTFHHGRTLHYTRGNSTATARRAFIANFRPQSMIEFEREHGFDHGKQGIQSITKDSE